MDKLKIIYLLFSLTLELSNGSGNLDNSSNCSDIKTHLGSLNIGNLDRVPKDKQVSLLEVCHLRNKESLSCCTHSMEELFQGTAAGEFRKTLHSVSSHLKTILADKAKYYKDSFQLLLHTVENNTDHLFATTYGNKIPLKDRKGPIRSFFLDLRAYLNKEDVDVRNSIERFFDELFPLVFHNVLINPSSVKELDDDYRECLMEVRQELTPKPFGEVPNHLAHQLSRSLSVARLFLDSLNLAVHTINTTAYVNIGDDCVKALTRLNYCSLCQGYTSVTPCRNYCYNVLHGCLASVIDLNGYWNEFVEALDLLSDSMMGVYNFEKHLHGLHQQISDAIMNSMETGPKLYKQVIDSSKCGPPKVASELASPSGMHSGIKLNTLLPKESNVHLVGEIMGFMKTLKSSKGFFYKLAEAMCTNDIKYSEEPDDTSCWNGQNLGMYQSGVTGKEFETQVRDNPEVKVSRIKDSQIIYIRDQLATKKKLLNSKASQGMMQNDDNGDYSAGGNGKKDQWYHQMEDWDVNSYQNKGHGSGDGGMMNDDEDYTVYSGSGSGDGGQRINTRHHPSSNQGATDDDITFDPPYVTPNDLIGSAPCQSGLSIITITLISSIVSLIFWLNG